MNNIGWRKQDREMASILTLKRQTQPEGLGFQGIFVPASPVIN
jgi:hypothetical protein